MKPGITWSAENRAPDGSLIVRMASMDYPDPPACATPKCLAKWMMDCFKFWLIQRYHARRVKYATRNKGKKILDRYRTGDRAPETILMALIAHIKLTCPVCRRFETKYW